MNYDKLTKNSGIKKSKKKDIRDAGLEIQSDVEIENLPDGDEEYPTLSRKKTKKLNKFFQNMDAKDEAIMNQDFVIWFIRAHHTRTLPDDPREDEYVAQLICTFYLTRIFPKDKRFSEALDLVWDPEYRKALTPLKYQSADMLEVA